jgi:hypothetical protein
MKLSITSAYCVSKQIPIFSQISLISGSVEIVPRPQHGCADGSIMRIASQRLPALNSTP